MLIFIGDAKSATSDSIGKGMSLHSVVVEHHLGRLHKAEYLVQNHVPMIGAMWSLSDRGNAYLIKNKLVPTPNLPPNNPRGHPCDHCNSTRLRRTRSIPDPTFGDVGIKQVFYICLDCGKESGFTNDQASA